MHPVSVLIGIFLSGYITARWDLVTRLYELAIFAWDHGVIVRIPRPLLNVPPQSLIYLQTRAAKGFAILSIFFLLLLIPIERIAAREAFLVSISTGFPRSQLALILLSIPDRLKPV